MDPLDNSRAVAQELVSLAQEQGVDLDPLRKDDVFIKDQRWVWFWRKDSLPGTGPADEPLGTLHYNMQGTISRLQGTPKQVDVAFRAVWSEAGTLESIEQAFGLAKAWLLEGKEIDELPARDVRRSGMG
jgi:hypothetical protein